MRDDAELTTRPGPDQVPHARNADPRRDRAPRAARPALAHRARAAAVRHHARRRLHRRGAKNFPNEPAVIDELGTVTFRELDERTNALAHALPPTASAGRRRRDHVPQPPRLDRLRGRLPQARRERAVPQHRVLRPAADRGRQEREAEGGHLRPRVRGGAQATRASGASATSPGTSPRTARSRTRAWRT